jgi:hypothetical protein
MVISSLTTEQIWKVKEQVGLFWGVCHTLLFQTRGNLPLES